MPPEDKHAQGSWSVVHENDVGPDDESFCEWWEVTDGTRTFKTNCHRHALWLCDILNISTDFGKVY